MTVGNKLLISVGSMLALSAIMGVASLDSVSQLNSELETATLKTARRLQLGGEVETNGTRMLAGMRGIVMFTFLKDPSRVAAARQLTDNASKGWQSSIDELRPLVVREEGMVILNRLHEQLTAWKEVIREVHQMASAGNPEAAGKIAIAKGLPIYLAHERDAKRFREIQNEILTSQRAMGNSLVSRSRWIAMLLLGLAIAVGVAVLTVVRRTTATLQKAAADLSQNAARVASAAGEISASSQTLAQGASQQAASIEETSASSQQITAMTRQNVDSSQGASSLMIETSHVVDEANRTLEQMEASMHDINASSEKIGRIIKVIDEIAFQTNILALNAAVEAARAGEAGMGFAVVADEVRNLAQRSAQAAKDTATLIEESISKSGEGRIKLDQVSKAIREITSRAQKVKTLIEEVHHGSTEQARGIEQISKAVLQMEQVAQNSAAGAEQTAAAGQDLTSQATALNEVVSDLQALVGATGEAGGSHSAPAKRQPLPKALSKHSSSRAHQDDHEVFPL